MQIRAAFWSRWQRIAPLPFFWIWAAHQPRTLYWTSMNCAIWSCQMVLRIAYNIAQHDTCISPNTIATLLTHQILINRVAFFLVRSGAFQLWMLWKLCWFMWFQRVVREMCFICVGIRFILGDVQHCEMLVGSYLPAFTFLRWWYTTDYSAYISYAVLKCCLDLKNG